MGFQQKPMPALWQAPLSKATVTIVDGKGLQLSGLNSFHLEEGPHFNWFSLYRVLADGCQLDVPRERPPAAVREDDGALVVHWASTAQLKAEITAHYRVNEAEMAIDITWSIRALTAYTDLELFIASYFTPYYRPRYAVRDARIHPQGIGWYEKTWYGVDPQDAWLRDSAARRIFQDGRWLTGYPLNWRPGPSYAAPLMIQEHRYGHAIVSMGRRRDCLAISGFFDYHNSQYFHLFGQSVAAGETLQTVTRLVLLIEWTDLTQAAQRCYQQWTQEELDGTAT